jgi:hypothetical protein
MPSPILERVKAHREALGRKEIEVEEWPDEAGAPTILFCSPVTLAEMRKWYKGISGEDISVLVDVVITKAEDKDGERVFSLEDKQPLLRTAEFSVLSRVATEMLDHESSADLEKN